jgi:hypothetical protein
MSASLIWLHEEALRISHLVFKAAPRGTKAIYVWDDAYFREADYSLKRLVFIYETLCELPIEIIWGNTLEVLRELAPSNLYVPATNNPMIAEMIGDLKIFLPVEIIEDEDFVVIKNSIDFRRFFQYWKKAQKTAFLHNGGVNA